MFKFFKNAILCCAISLIATGCTSPRIEYSDREVAIERFNQPMLFIQPITKDIDNQKYTLTIGENFKNALNKKFGGRVIYSDDIEGLKQKFNHDKLLKNGVINTNEVIKLGDVLETNSILVCQVIDYSPYPPFRATTDLTWFDASSGKIIARLYQNIDLNDLETRHRYSTYVGDGVSRNIYEFYFYAKSKSQTASLMPQTFMKFIADYSSEVMFNDIVEDNSWRTWNLF
ncbi:hypothetical protein AAEX28_05610 [Lentisphaerota bacterium WC36G]|nr:hypothetical protein LJT99_08470 [Lentisphaerae bacterium WC36]